MKLATASLTLAVLMGCATMTPEEEAAYIESKWGSQCHGDRACMMNAYNRELDRRSLSSGECSRSQSRWSLGKSIDMATQDCRARSGSSTTTCTSFLGFTSCKSH